MILRKEWSVNLRPKHLPKNDPNWAPLPGDPVADGMDYDGTFGIVISVFQDDDGHKALVLWGKDLSISPTERHQREVFDKMKQQMIDEEDAFILNTLRDLNEP